MTSHRTKPPAPAGQAERVSLGDLGHAGRDRRSAAQYARDLAAETERDAMTWRRAQQRLALERPGRPRSTQPTLREDRSLARDPKRWTRRRTNEVPKDRSTEPEAPP